MYLQMVISLKMTIRSRFILSAKYSCHDIEHYTDKNFITETQRLIFSIGSKKINKNLTII